MLSVDLEQIRKYNVPGPRYTSYPPAVHFKPELSTQLVLDSLRENNRTARDISLYFHIPFCHSLCWYCGCNTVITRNQSQSRTYLDYLGKEMAFISRLTNPQRKVTQIHLGGGTPTFLTPDEIRRHGEMVRQYFQVAPDVESSVEVDPRRLRREHIEALRQAGHNRLSIGVQDIDPHVQAAINRIQPFELSRQTVEWARACGFQSISIDLIYGLPHQTVNSFATTLDRILTLQPDRLALFSYAHVPWIKPAQKLLKAEAMPPAETKFAIFKLAVERLTSEGYAYIGMDHFARRGDELEIAQREGKLQRNFQGYSTRAGADIHAFGMTSISQTPDIYWQNEKLLKRYYDRLDAGELPVACGYALNSDDRLRRDTIMRLMCDMKLDYPSMSRSLGVDFSSYFAREIAGLANLEQDGLIETERHGMRVTQSGRLLIRNIAMCFDPHVAEQLKAPREGVYSRTI
jgi:oxygen-independent coproporphyrinogen-3 oxidase